VAEQAKAVREIRINPIVPSESVLVSTARGMRPRKAEETVTRDTRSKVGECPFCRGNEDRTPPTLFSYPDPTHWEIRIVENLYPVLGDDRAPGALTFGLQQVIDGYGRHEVVIDHPNHGIGIHEMSERHLAALFQCYRDRMRALYASDARLRYVLVFKNFGPAAGASIAHSHSQIIATPVVPENVQNELGHTRDYHRKVGRCIFCALIDEALTFEATVYDRETGQVRRRVQVGQYVVERGERFVAVKPFASRYEWEVHVYPIEHQCDFADTDDSWLADLGRVVKRTMARLDRVIGGAQYNFFLHSLPHGPDYTDCRASYHWHLEICPRTSIPTGFELGSGLFVSTVSPEDAAQRLRDVVL
jgi:UDPglucose--hexose-1-phosphate uridylyltransferase